MLPVRPPKTCFFQFRGPYIAFYRDNSVSCALVRACRRVCSTGSCFLCAFQQVKALGFIVLDNSTTYVLLDNKTDFKISARNGDFTLSAASELEALTWLTGACRGLSAHFVSSF